MQIDHELIETLVLKEISGDISAPETALLDQMLNSSASARELAVIIRKKVDSVELNNYLQTNGNKVFTQEVLFKIYERKKKRKSILRYVSISVAASLIVFIGVWYSLIRQEANGVYGTITRDPHTSNNIILQLPGGEAMQLDSTEQKLQVGKLTINTRNRMLSYTDDEDASLMQYATLVVPAGKDYKILLKDGSEIHLNAATKLRFPLTFKGVYREISVDGEAYLKVARNARMPFIVHLPNGTVEVLGTEFNVNTYDSSRERVSLVSGSLKVTTAASTALLKPGMEAVATLTAVDTGMFNIEEVLAWKEGKYYIDNATLTELSAVLSRWYGCTVIVDTEKAAIQRFTGVLYRNQPVEFMLKSIQLTNTISYTKDENGIIHIK
ncbi:FecR family protein [Chitinophaga sp. S165]|uniref:FecR family protein n=1 Tax=Chitinophaga sp. S165 TaxID=2135462 RepID=UPI000D70EA33|nr:FecR domain-containing protein [Chitinophaga sp. S165]PWV55502.1 FecR family protein [Chitinophaga sp. S165]